jgi:hypothetical protein
MAMRILVLAVAFVITTVANANAAVPDRRIGTAAQVVNAVYGNLQSTHQSNWLHPGLNVFQNETIVTNQSSASSMIFQDDTRLSVGPISMVKLDRFVFNPDPSTSVVTVSLLKGAFRFVSGNLPKPDYLIRTPAAVIGVRGTDFTVFIAPNGSELISVESGTIYVTCHHNVTVPVYAGQMTYIRSAEGSAGKPQPASAIPAITQLNAMLH